MAGKNNKNEQQDPGIQNSEFQIQRPSSDIPKFDLAEEIMAEQRKISATRRKRAKIPSSRKRKKSGTVGTEPYTQPISHTIGQPRPALGGAEQEEIIAQIVARDITKLLQGESRNTS